MLEHGIFSRTPVSAAGVFHNFPVPKASTLKAIGIEIEAVLASAVTFDVLKNGVTVFAAPGDRPTIAAGQTRVILNTLNVALAQFDYLSFSVDGVPSGGIVVKGILTDIENGIVIPSGGSGFSSPDTPPAAPHADDEEFDSSGLSSAWTEVQNTQPTLTYVAANTALTRSWLRVNTTGRYQIRKPATATTGDFSLTAKIAAVLRTDNHRMSLFLGDTNGLFPTNGIEISYGHSASSAYLFCYRVVSGARTVQTSESLQPPGGTPFTAGVSNNPPFIYVHVQRVGGVISAWWSRNGATWERFTGQFTSTFSTAFLSIMARAEGTSATSYGVDWIRRDLGTLAG